MSSRLRRIKMAVAGVLGHTCQVCHGAGWWSWERTDPLFVANSLQVGHPNGRKWSIRKLSRHSRWLRYLCEALAGKVQAECGPCNRKHGGSIRYKKVDRTRQGAPRKRMGSKSNPWPIRQTAHTCWCGDIDCRDHT